MDCCSHSKGLNTIFDERNARSEVEEYWKKGIDKHAHLLVDAVSARGVRDASLLEVGGGVGGLHTELLKRGASHATDVDISTAYISAAKSVTEKLGLRDRVDYREADFAGEADSVPPADVVILHRVVCCYPDMPGLVTAAAQHANRLLALTFPGDAWYMRLGEKLFNFGLWLSRSNFRFYVHRAEAILRVAAASGLKPVQQKLSWPWQIVVFERAA